MCTRPLADQGGAVKQPAARLNVPTTGRLVAQRYRVAPFLPEIIRSGYSSGYTIEYDLPWYMFHDRVG